MILLCEGVPTPYYVESIETEIRKFVGDTNSQGFDTGGGYEVGSHVHRPYTSKGITVGDPVKTLGILQTVNHILGGR